MALKIIVNLLLIHLLAAQLTLFGQNGAQESKYRPIDLRPFADSRNHWYGIRDAGNIVNPVANQPKYAESEILKIADNILLYQRNNGGWPKNYDMQAILTQAQVDSLKRTRDREHTTFDNSTTFSHVEYLAQVYAQVPDDKYRDAALKGIAFILKAQYPNGGWPQYYPLEKKNYSSHITYNDGAFIGVMETLRKIKDNNPMFSFVGPEMRKQAAIACDKGLECILKTQIISRGRKTAWCQQHDEVTLQPAWARAYEMPAICNGESAGIVLFLMSLDHPGTEVIDVVQSAVKWFGDSKIEHTRIKSVEVKPVETSLRTVTSDRVVVDDQAAPPIWTRYNELETERPLFSDRNGKMLYSLAEVSLERRSGYSWYTYAPQSVLDKYPAWQKKWAPDRDVLAK